MADKNIRFKFTQSGAQNVSGSTNKIDMALKDAAKSALKFAGAYFGVRGVIAGIKSTAGAAIEQEQVFRKLQTSIELTGRNYNDLKGEIDDTFASLQAMTEFGDTDSAQALTTLVQLTGDYESSMKQLPLVLDMASTGLFDMSTAARYVAMALEGNAEALGRYVPQLRATNNEIIKNGTAAEKAEEAMRILNEKFGGTAQKNLESTTGLWKQFKNYLGDIGEMLGGPLLSQLQGIINVGIRFVQTTEMATTAIDAENKKLGELKEQLRSAYETGILDDVSNLNQATIKYSLDLAVLSDALKSNEISIMEYRMEAARLRQEFMDEYPAISQIREIRSEIEASIDPITAYGEAWINAIPASVRMEIDGIVDAVKNTDIEKLLTEPINEITAPDFSKSERGLENMLSYGQQFTDSLAQAIIYQQDLGDAIKSTILSVASTIASKAALFALASFLFPGSSAIAFTKIFGFQEGGVVGGFADGGIVSGTSYTGDRQIVRVNSGEMVLNKQQQANLFELANGRNVNNSNAVNINISGDFIGTPEMADKLAQLIYERSKDGFNKIAIT